MLTIGKTKLDTESFRVRGSYSDTIARLFALPIAVENKVPVTIDVVTKGTDFKPYQGGKRVYWNEKLIGFFAVGNVAQEWDGGKYKTRFELRQCEASDFPEGEIPLYKWRYDLRALAERFPETDGAKLEAGRTFDPFANSWKQPTNLTQTGTGRDDYNLRPRVLSIEEGGTNADQASLALLNLGGIPSSSRGIPFGVAPLGADGKVPLTFLPPMSGGGGGDYVSTATFNTAISLLVPTSTIGAASGITPLGSDSKVPSTYLPAPPTLASLNGVSTALIGAASGIAPLAANTKISAFYMPINNAYIDTAQTFTQAQSFTSGISVKGGNPPDLTTGIWQAVDANGFPRIWIVNSLASVNNRVKSITIATNGNIQIRHHNDNLTDGNVLEHTASGNILTNGTLRPGGGTSNFAGASFLPGAIFFRSDINMLVYSDGTSWRRMDTNAVV